MTILPFVCLAIGIILGIFVKSNVFIAIAEKVSTIALMLLMLSIVIGIGLDQSVIDNLTKIGLDCLIISFSAIGMDYAS